MSNNIKIKPTNINPTFTGLKFKKRPLITISKKTTDVFNREKNTNSKTSDFLHKTIKKIGLLLPFLIKQREKNNEYKNNTQTFITKENLDYIPQRGNQQFSRTEKKILQNLPDEQYKRAKKLFFIEGRKKQLNVLDMETLYTLNDEAFNNAQKLLFIPERGEKQFSAEEINTFCVLFASKFNRVEELSNIPERKENQFDFESIYKIASLSSEEYKKAKELFFIPERKDKQLEYDEIIKLSQLSDEGFIEAKKILHTKNRSIPLDADAIIRILEFDEITKEKIYTRNLLNDIEINKQKVSLTFNEINFLADFDDNGWQKIKAKNLFNILLNSQPRIISRDLWKKIIKLSNEDLKKTFEIISDNNSEAIFLSSAIIEKNGKYIFDDEGFDWAKKFTEFTEKNTYAPIYANDIYTKGLRDEKGNIKKDIAQKLHNFLKQLSSEEYDFYDISEIFQAQIKQYSKLQLETFIPENNKTHKKNKYTFTQEDLAAKINMYQKLKNYKIFKKFEITAILGKTQHNTQDFITKLISLDIPQKDKINIINLKEENLIFLADKNIPKLLNDTNTQYNHIIRNPQQYINGFALPTNVIEDKINSFIKTYKKNLILASAIFDKETIHNILRLRLDNAEKYLSDITELNTKELELLSHLASSQNKYNKPFLPTQKIQFIDIMKAYKENKLDFSKMYDMAQKRIVNIPELNIDLLKNLLKKAGLSEKEINSIQKEKLLKWDTNNIHLLAKEVENQDKETLEVLKISSISNNFLSHILKLNNEYSEMNYTTKVEFITNGLNFEKWINPPQELKFSYTKTGERQQFIHDIQENVANQINILLKTPAGVYIKKQLHNFIKNNNFEFPKEYNEKNLIELLDTLTDTTEKGKLHKVWKRAYENSQHPEKPFFAFKTLNILKTLRENKKSITSHNQESLNKTLNYTIKMWDRNPQKDLFQGNYSTCCIGMGYGNGSAMPNYLLNTAFNMIEIVDNKNNEIIGNALCFWATDTQNKPALIIDNIEINNTQKDFLSTNNDLRNAIFNYTQNIARTISGNKDCHIYMGTRHNDINCEDLKYANEKLCPIGKLNPENTYLDVFNGWLKDKKPNKFCPLYEIQ